MAARRSPLAVVGPQRRATPSKLKVCHPYFAAQAESFNQHAELDQDVQFRWEGTSLGATGLSQSLNNDVRPQGLPRSDFLEDPVWASKPPVEGSSTLYPTSIRDDPPRASFPRLSVEYERDSRRTASYVRVRVDHGAFSRGSNLIFDPIPAVYTGQGFARSPSSYVAPTPTPPYYPTSPQTIAQRPVNCEGLCPACDAPLCETRQARYGKISETKVCNACGQYEKRRNALRPAALAARKKKTRNLQVRASPDGAFL